MLLRELQELQDLHGYLPAEELQKLAARGIAPAVQVEELASGFPTFNRRPLPGCVVRACRDLTCEHRGSAALEQGLRAAGIPVIPTSCLGQCDRAPAVVIDQARHGAPATTGPARKEHIVPWATVERVRETAAIGVGAVPPVDTLLPWVIDIYAGRPDYAAIRAYDADPQPEALLAELQAAGLLGMGGAGGRVWKKWGDVRSALGRSRYVVCNADESEPGTFKDRELLLRVPWLVIEGMILAARVVGARQAYLFIRHEYPLPATRVREEIARAEALGLCGPATVGTSRHLTIEVVVSPGGYICGEQSALIEVLEGRRAEPRNRPPELTTNGLFNQPTLINNVETFAWAPRIALTGGAAFREDHGRGRRFLSVSGDVRHPGVYEVPVGTTVREFLEHYANREVRSDPFKAIAPGGLSGGFLPRRLPLTALPTPWPGSAAARLVLQAMRAGQGALDVLDLELDLTLFRELGLMLGGGLVVFGPGTDMVPRALAGTRFFRDESCGKCVPCRLGTQRLVEIVTDLVERKLDVVRLAGVARTVRDLSDTMTRTSICGLGQVAHTPLVSLFRYFPEDIARYLRAAD